jgi:hypothetical protein
VSDMAGPGLVFNCFAVVLTSIYSFLAGRIFFGVEVNQIPEWATST